MKYQRDDDWWSIDRRVRLLDADLTVEAQAESENEPTAHQLKVLASAELLGPSFEEQLRSAAKGYFHRTSEVINLAEEGILVDVDRIGEHFRLKVLLIPEHGPCEDDIFIIHGDCDWEEEHGLQVVVLNGDVVRCDQQDSLIWGGTWTEVLAASPSDRRLLLQSY